MAQTGREEKPPGGGNTLDDLAMAANASEANSKEDTNPIRRLFRYSLDILIPFFEREEPKLYSATSLDVMAENMMVECLTEENFDDDLRSIRGGYKLEDLIRTIRETRKSKVIVEKKLRQMTLNELTTGDEKAIRNLKNEDNYFASVLASGYNLLFNIALSELHYLTQDFPEDFSKKCRDECQEVMRKAVGDLREEIEFKEGTEEDKARFVYKKSGEEFKRDEKRTFQQRYNYQRDHNVGGDYTADERAVIAVYKAFAAEIKVFRDDYVLLKACVKADDQHPTNEDSILGDLAEISESSKVIKLNRYAMRHAVTEDILYAFKELEPGYHRLKKFTKVRPKVPGWAKKMKPTWRENLKLRYIGMKDEMWGNAVAYLAIGNSIINVAGLGILQATAKKVPAVNTFLENTPGISQYYDGISDDLFKTFSTIALLGVFDKLPGYLLKQAHKATQGKPYR